VGEEKEDWEATGTAVVVSIRQAVEETRRRLRMAVALSAMARYLPLGVVFFTPAAITYRFEIITGTVLLCWGAGCLLGVLWFIAKRIERAPSSLSAALRLDRSHGLSGRLPAVLDFLGDFSESTRSGSGSSDSAGFASLLMREEKAFSDLSPAQAAPVSVPRSLSWSVAMCGLLAVLLTATLRTETPPTAKHAEAPENAAALWVSEDDAEILRRRSEQLKKELESEEGQNAASRFNEIVVKVVEGELNKKEAFRLAAELSADLSSAAEEADALKEGLSRRGSRLSERKITREIGDALKEGRLSDAEEAMRRLSERLQQGDEPLSSQELNELREALKEALKERETTEKASKEKAGSSRRSSLSKRAEELRKKKQSGKVSAQEQAELDQAERELKRLDRQKERQKSSAREALSELDRELARAAKELQKEQKKAGQFLDRARQQVSKARKKKLTDKEKKELLKQIRELKERLRRQNKDGKAKERLRKFQKRARGQGSEGKQGAPRPGKQGKSGQPGGGKMKLGPGGQPIPVPSEGSDGEGATPSGAGKTPGTAHDPDLLGQESRLENAGSEDKSAVAQDTGAGQSASETIVTAAEEGFSSSSYERLFQEYRTVAEEVMERETVPPGRKAHVRRYFELIRPREGSSSAEKEAP